jgi:hypothetical protein
MRTVTLDGATLTDCWSNQQSSDHSGLEAAIDGVNRPNQLGQPTPTRLIVETLNDPS